MPKAILVYDKNRFNPSHHTLNNLSDFIRKSLADMIEKDFTWIDFVCQPIGEGSVMNSDATLEIEFISSDERLEQFNQAALKDLKKKICSHLEEKMPNFLGVDLGIWTKPLQGSIHV